VRGMRGQRRRLGAPAPVHDLQPRRREGELALRPQAQLQGMTRTFFA
jgi:hypothetical protein